MHSPTRLDAAFDDVRRAVTSDRLSQAYLIVGAPRGDGLRLAERIVALLLCEAGTKPCGTCRSCRLTREHTHPDVHWVEPQKKSQRILVEPMRELQDTLYRTSFAGGWKAGVLVGADRLGTEAANAFLKILEEPPPKTLFLLLSDAPQGLLATVLSRCQRIVLSGEQAELPEPWHSRLMDTLVTAGSGAGLAGFVEADRLSVLLKEIRKSVEDEVEQADDPSGAGDADTLEARVQARYKELRTALLRTLVLWHRDVLVARCGVADTQLRSRERARAVRECAAALTHGEAQRNVSICERMQAQLEANLPEELVFASGLIGTARGGRTSVR